MDVDLVGGLIRDRHHISHRILLPLGGDGAEIESSLYTIVRITEAELSPSASQSGPDTSSTCQIDNRAEACIPDIHATVHALRSQSFPAAGPLSQQAA